MLFRSDEKYVNEKSIENLNFSHKWVKGFLKRGGLIRRKISIEDKATPTDEEIRRILKIGQDIYINKGHNADTYFNFDETAFTYAIGPTHIFVPGINSGRPISVFQMISFELQRS